MAYLQRGTAITERSKHISGIGFERLRATNNRVTKCRDRWTPSLRGGVADVIMKFVFAFSVSLGRGARGWWKVVEDIGTANKEANYRHLCDCPRLPQILVRYKRKLYCKFRKLGY